MNIGEWSALHVSLVALAWPLLVLGYVAFRLIRLYSSGAGGAFASAGIRGLFLLVGPPLVLVTAWLILRRR